MFTTTAMHGEIGIPKVCITMNTKPSSKFNFTMWEPLIHIKRSWYAFKPQIFAWKPKPGELKILISKQNINWPKNNSTQESQIQKSTTSIVLWSGKSNLHVYNGALNHGQGLLLQRSHKDHGLISGTLVSCLYEKKKETLPPFSKAGQKYGKALWENIKSQSKEEPTHKRHREYCVTNATMSLTSFQIKTTTWNFLVAIKGRRWFYGPSLQLYFSVLSDFKFESLVIGLF